MKLKTVIIFILVFTIITTVIVLASMYIADSEFRDNVDRYILKKEVFVEDTSFVLIDSEENPYICSYSKYIAIISKNKLKAYTANAKKDFELDISVSNPLTSSNADYLAVAEKNGSKLYSISEKSIKWTKEVEGEIAKIVVNSRGLIAVTSKQTSYKTIIILFDKSGKEVFKTYLATNSVVAMDISDDNKHLCFAEANSSGMVIEYNIKVIDIAQAKVIYTYVNQDNRLILNINIQDKNRIVCMYDDKVSVISETDNQVVYENFKDMLFVDIGLDNSIFNMKNSELSIMNLNNKKESVYKVEDVPKTVKSYGKNIAINFGQEAYFINSNGWLLKRYESKEEIKDIILGNKIAGIVYRNRINFIKI